MRTRAAAAVVAVVAVLAAACSGGVRTAAPPAAPPPASASAVEDPPAEEPPAEDELGEEIWDAGDPPPAPDVDGDGLPDLLGTVETPDRSSDAWRWGVRVTMSRLGEQTLWRDCCTNEGQEALPVGDVDGDGDAELAGSDGATAVARDWFLVTLDGGRLARVAGPELWTGIADGEVTWSCVRGGGIVVAASALDAQARPGTTGTRTYYRLDGTRLVRTRTVHDRWGAGVPRPAEYDSFLACG